MQAPPDGSSGGVRGGLAGWLRDQRAVPPNRDEVSKDEGCGFVEIPFERGLVDLLPESADRTRRPLRLVWEKRDRSRARPVPPGTWLVRHYVIEREQAGREWMLSCTGGEGPTIVVKPGETTKIPIDPGMRIGWTAKRTKSGIGLTLAVTGHGGMEASLLDAGRKEIDRRVVASYEILDTAGTRLVAGSLAYG